MGKNSLKNDFYIKIGHSKDNFYKLSAKSLEGKSDGLFSFSFEQKEIKNLLMDLEEGNYGEQELKVFGKILYDILFNEETKLLYSKTAQKIQKPLNLHLKFSKNAESLINLPWELLFDEMHFLVSSGSLNLVRYLDLPKMQIEKIDLPFKILLIISRPLSGSVDELSFYYEREAIIRGLYSLQNEDNVIIDVISPPTHDEVINRLLNHKYDAIHLMGMEASLIKKAICYLKMNLWNVIILIPMYLLIQW